MAARPLNMPGGKPKLREEGTCRIFFSSPFGGMEEEREELTRRYFPQIHSLCSGLGLKFVAVDMRWGITSEAAERAQVINICLRELDRSDMFVGFFGQRYGWHGAEDALLQRNFDNAVGSYPWLGAVRDRSVTELEFLHGHLNLPGSLPSVIAFRDKAYDDMRRAEGERAGDKKQVFKYSAESQLASAMMEDLKQRVEATRDQLLGCYMNYPTPEEAARLIFDAVWKHLTQVLLRDIRPVAMSRLEQRRAEHEAFRSSLSALYLGGQSYLQQLNTWIIEDTKEVEDSTKGDASGDESGDAKNVTEGGESGAGDVTGVLVTGARGSGKSALLCNWLTSASTHPHLLPLSHFVGVAPSTTDPGDILSYLLEELKHHVKEAQKEKKGGEKTDPEGKEDAKEEGSKKENSRNIVKLQTDIALALAELGKQGTHVVLVIDGLDKVQQSDKTMKHLFWLPRAAGVRLTLLVSTLDSDAESVKELVEKSHFCQLCVKPLDLATQQQLCVETLKESGKELDQKQLERVVAVSQTENPLFLKVVLHELSVFGYFRELDKKIDSLIGCKDVTELMQQYLQRLETDYNVPNSHDNLVQQVLGSLVLARRGLSEAELMEIWQVPQKVWSPLFFALERYVINQGGLLRLALSELKEAVTQKYLNEEEFRKEVADRLIEYFKKELPTWLAWRGVEQEACQRASEELPWLYRQLEDKEGLTATLTHLGVFTKLLKQQPYWLVELWAWVGETWSKVADLYSASADQAVVECYLQKVNRPDLYTDSNSRPVDTEPCFQMVEIFEELCDFFDSVNHWPGKEQFLERELEILKGHVPAQKAEEYLLCTINVRYQLACVYVETGLYDKAAAQHQEVIVEYKKLLETKPEDARLRSRLAWSYNGLGTLAEKRRDWDKAAEHFQESLTLHLALGNTREVGESYINLASVLMQKGSLEEAVDFFGRAEKALEETYPGQLHPVLGNLLANKGVALRRLDRLEEAKACYERSLLIKANALGWGHLSLTVTYINMAMLDLLANNFDKAEQKYQRALDLYRSYDVPVDENDHLKCLENMVVALINQKKYHEALPYYTTILKIYESRKMEGCIPSVHQDMVRFYFTEGMMDEAERVVLALLDSCHKDPINYVQLEILDRQKDPNRRPRRAPYLSLRHAFSLYPGDIRIARELLIKDAIPNDDKYEAFRLLEAVNEANPEFEHTTYKFGAIVSSDQGNHVLALCILEQGLQLYPGNQELKIQVLETLRKAGRWGEAAVQGEELLADMADNASLVFVTGHSALQAGQLTRAVELLSQVTVMDDENMADKAKMLLKILQEAETEASDKAGQEAEGGQASGEVGEDTTSDAGAAPGQSESAEQKNPSDTQPSQSDTEPSVSDSTCAQVEEMKRNALRQDGDNSDIEEERGSPLSKGDLQAATDDLSPTQINSACSEIRRDRRPQQTAGDQAGMEESEQKAADTQEEIPSQQDQKAARHPRDKLTQPSKGSE